MAGSLDPVKFEVFFKRLMTILEEGRKAIAMTSGSPAIVEGGEFMTSFYGGEGKGVLTAAGTLFHVMGSSDAIMHAIEEYTENPGINDGDQFFYNDPYIAGTHLLDQIMIKPIFNQGRRVAWVGTMTHTGDSGGLLRGISTEIFHEGWKFKGIKIVEGNEVRKDIFECIINQSRDPQYVALDLLARVAANNVCEKEFMRLVEKFGIDFIQSAFEKIRADARNLVREKIKNLPDGTWKERVYVCRTVEEDQKEKPLPLKIEVALTIEGDRLSFDCTASPQTEDYFNATLACSRSCLWTSLAGSLFYDVPWSSEMMNWVDYSVEEGSFINCRYPASCGLGTNAGQTLIAAAAGCVAKLLYAAGEHEYVNASWGGRLRGHRLLWTRQLVWRA